MVRAAPLILALAIAGCGLFESDFERAERRYNFLKANRADSAELCRAGKAVAQAAIDEGNSFEYKMWNVTAGLDCNDDLLSRI